MEIIRFNFINPYRCRYWMLWSQETGFYYRESWGALTQWDLTWLNDYTEIW